MAELWVEMFERLVEPDERQAGGRGNDKQVNDDSSPDSLPIAEGAPPEFFALFLSHDRAVRAQAEAAILEQALPSPRYLGRDRLDEVLGYFSRGPAEC